METTRLLSELETSFRISRDTQIVIASGYFDASTGIDEFAVESMRAGLQLGNELRIMHSLGRAPAFAVIVNDLGMACSQDVCELRPATTAINTLLLEELCAPYGATFDVVKERTLRNRSARFLKKWLKDPSSDRSLILEGDEVVFASDLYPKVLAGAVNGAGIGIPRCPLIVSEYLDMSFRRLSASKQKSSRLVLDFNRVADRDKVIKGTEMYLARKSQGHEAVVQVFFDASTHDFVSVPFHSDDFGRMAA